MIGHVFEKYHAEMVGYPGRGGEYIVQEGFGWSNGVILWMLNQFGSVLHAPICPAVPFRVKPLVDSGHC